MLANAEVLLRELNDYLTEEQKANALVNLTGKLDRYVVYKIGPVLAASHGIGVPSMSILMHEMFKLLSHAGAECVEMFRLGTSGGLGLEPGSLVVTTEAVNPQAEAVYEQFICGKKSRRSTKLPPGLVDELLECKLPDDKFKIVPGKTMCGDDFYEAQGRLDGAICNYTKEDKANFIKFLHDNGVKNIEMECTAFAALTTEVKIRSAIMCVTLVNRLIDDQVKTDHDQLKEMEMRPIKVFARYVKKKLDASKSN